MGSNQFEGSLGGRSRQGQQPGCWTWDWRKVQIVENVENITIACKFRTLWGDGCDSLQKKGVLSLLFTWKAMRTDLADVLAEVSTCITASMGSVGFLLNENLSTFGSSGISASAWGLSICPADWQWNSCSKVQEGPDPGKKSRSQNSVVTLHPTRTMGVWGLMRRTRGNQEVASASKDDLAIKLDEGNDQSIRKPVANYVAK